MMKIYETEGINHPRFLRVGWGGVGRGGDGRGGGTLSITLKRWGIGVIQDVKDLRVGDEREERR